MMPEGSPQTGASMSTHTSELQYHSRHGTLAMLVSLTCFTGNALLLKVLASIRHVDPWMSLAFRAGSAC
jgi:hypothetical protein